MRQRLFREKVERTAEMVVELGEALAGAPDALVPAVLEEVGRAEWDQVVGLMAPWQGEGSPPRSRAPSVGEGAGMPEVATGGRGDNWGWGLCQWRRGRWGVRGRSWSC